jgi:uncharacterized protein (DUF1778 family)
MRRFTLRLPEDLYRRATTAAKEQGVSLNQFLLYAVTDMVAEIEARRFFDERTQGTTPESARRGLESVLDRVPARKPASGDELPVAAGRKRKPKL